MSEAEHAREFAVTAHLGQVDHGGEPYYGHVSRVASRVAHLGDEYEAIALLHDVVEDTDTTLDDLREAGFPEEVVSVVDVLTRRHSETYSDFIERVSHNPVARKIKLADIADNTDESRAWQITHSLKDRYAKAKAFLTACEMTEGTHG